MKKHMTFCELTGALVMLALPAFAAEISLSGDNIILSFDNPDNATYKVERSTGRFGALETLGTTDEAQYTDALNGGNAHDLYYLLTNEAGDSIHLAMETQLFGSNTYIFRPTDNIDSILTTINRIGADMNGTGYNGQFSSNRYSFYFHPGQYHYQHSYTFERDEQVIDTTVYTPFAIGYYTSIAGLGDVPHKTSLHNVFALCPLQGSNVTCTFWRSIENVRITRTDGENFWWAVSQAAPMRRVYSERQTLFDLGKSASGGYAADCYFQRSASGWAQQQWYSRNCHYQTGTNGIGIPGWNHAYQGIEFGSESVANRHKDNWRSKGDNGSWGFLSNEPVTPIIREKPFLFYESGRYKVFVPDWRENCTGVSYSEDNPGEGLSYDLLDNFYVARPGVTAATLNAQLAAGKYLFFTPGIYDLEAPIHITRAGTIVMGTGYATLRPTDGNTTSVMIIDDVEDVIVASLLLDAGTSTRTLLQVGTEKNNTDHSGAPIQLSDLFFRVGGARDKNTHAEIAVEINANDVVADHFWIWRADHSYGVGWTRNTSKNGLVVNGDDVTIYGLFNEHFQEYQTLWNGENGRTYFYQCETPYDVRSQAEYMSHDGTVDGWAAYKVADNVTQHYACMMGVYDVFIRTGGKIAIENSIEVPNAEGVHIHNACNYGLSGGSGKGIRYVINGSRSSTINKQYKHYHIYDYCMTGVKEINADPDAQGAAIRMYPNPADEYVFIEGTGETPAISIYTLSGSLIATYVGKQAPVATLPSGSYLVRVQDAANSKVFKLIKQ
ncbi:MAG: T9SS type A sorting domain-containing protein [Paludibacteraceae bacterium]|nr:T9SS type A sorting domain-containing protein [Paludibacteraceae bacterium]